MMFLISWHYCKKICGNITFELSAFPIFVFLKTVFTLSFLLKRRFTISRTRTGLIITKPYRIPNSCTRLHTAFQSCIGYPCFSIRGKFNRKNDALYAFFQLFIVNCAFCDFLLIDTPIIGDSKMKNHHSLKPRISL